MFLATFLNFSSASREKLFIPSITHLIDVIEKVIRMRMEEDGGRGYFLSV